MSRSKRMIELALNKKSEDDRQPDPPIVINDLPIIRIKELIEHNIAPVSVAKFSNVLEAENISLFRPKKDQYEKCMAFKLGHITQDEYLNHTVKKEEARLEKQKDKMNEELYCVLMFRLCCIINPN
jgi:hypothetical protein